MVFNTNSINFSIWCALIIFAAIFRVISGRFYPKFFAILNISCFFFAFQYTGKPLSDGFNFAIFLLALALCFFSLDFCKKNNRFWILAILSPILLLLAAKGQNSLLFFGISFIAFRLSYLAYEVSNWKTGSVNILDYYGFAFFLPTAIIGPINTFENYSGSIEKNLEVSLTWNRLIRFFYGALKFFYFAPMGGNLTFSNLLPQFNYFNIFDLAIASALFYLLLYLRFSGLCDMMISISAVLGIDVKENFRSPWQARNIADFWRRWHISLMDIIRDLVVSPLSYFLFRIFGHRLQSIAYLISVFVGFLVIGVWHGLEWHHCAYVIVHAAGVSFVHFYDKFLLFFLNDNYQAYQNSKFIYGVSWFLTFWFISFSYILFAYSDSDLIILWNNFRWFL